MAETALALGARAPDFTAPDRNGQSPHLAKALERSAQVLVV